MLHEEQARAPPERSPGTGRADDATGKAAAAVLWWWSWACRPGHVLESDEVEHGVWCRGSRAGCMVMDGWWQLSSHRTGPHRPGQPRARPMDRRLEPRRAWNQSSRDDAVEIDIPHAEAQGAPRQGWGRASWRLGHMESKVEAGVYSIPTRVGTRCPGTHLRTGRSLLPHLPRYSVAPPPVDIPSRPTERERHPGLPCPTLLDLTSPHAPELLSSASSGPRWLATCQPS